MNRFVAMFAVAAGLVASASVFAGEPSGRYRGAVGASPVGAEHLPVDRFHNSYGGVTATFAEKIPAGQGGQSKAALLQPTGRGHTVTASNVPSDAEIDDRLAERD
jgi:hypothetical protein